MLLKQHGVDAEIEVARKADLLIDRGDPDGQLRIKNAVAALMAPPAGLKD